MQATILRRMSHYSTASTLEAAYIIGGYDTQELIAEFKNDAWRQLGTLTKGRYGHGSITLGAETMIIGGSRWGTWVFSDLETQIWNFTNKNHTVINLTLPRNDYGDGIGLYIVPFDFCTT